MNWSLFLDDERYPTRYKSDWVVLRSCESAIEYCEMFGLPDTISFDHDLGKDKKTGMDFAKWLVDYCQNNSLDLPYFTIHSMNPVGSENIRGLLNSYLKMFPRKES